MSIAEFSKGIKNALTKSLSNTKEVHAIEFSINILSKSLNIKKKEATTIYKDIYFKITSTTSTYTGSTLKNNIYNIKSGRSITIVSPSKKVLVSYLKTIVAKPDKFENNSSVYTFSDIKLNTNLSAIKKVQNNTKDLKYSASFTKNADFAASKATGKLVFSVNSEIPEDVKQEILKEMKHYMFTGRASKSIAEALDEQIIERFKTSKNSKRYISKTKKSGKIKTKVKVKSYGLDIPKQLRDKSGRFQSIASLQALLAPLVATYVRANMDSASYFKTRTNRFTESTKVESVTNTAKGVLVNYSYMDYPYSVFERGGRLHQSGREPSTVMDSSIRKAAASLVSKQFNIITRNSNE